MWVPVELGVKLTEQLPPARLQEVGEKVPEALVVNPTEPVGANGEPGEESVTVALHVVAVLTGTLAGEHDTEVEVERRVTVTVVVPELVKWTVSPA